MEHSNQENRHHANEEFLQSLELLSEILQETVPPEETIPESNNNTSEKKGNQIAKNAEESELDLSIWEEAVADIEQYLQDDRK